MLEFLFEIIGEVLLQVIVEVTAELGMRTVSAPFERKPNAWFAGLGYALFGAAAGGLSLLVFPDHLVADRAAQLVNLIVTPVAVGGLMSYLGSLRARWGHERMRLDRFSYGYLFALSFALVRYFFAT